MHPKKLKGALLLLALSICAHAHSTVIELEPQPIPLPQGITCQIETLHDSGLSRGEVELVWQELVVKFTNQTDSWVFVSNLTKERIDYSVSADSETQIKELEEKDISFNPIGGRIAIGPKSTVAVFARVRKLEQGAIKNFPEVDLNIQISFTLVNETSKPLNSTIKGTAFRMGSYLVDGTISGPFLFSSMP